MRCPVNLTAGQTPPLQSLGGCFPIKKPQAREMTKRQSSKKGEFSRLCAHSLSTNPSTVYAPPPCPLYSFHGPYSSSWALPSFIGSFGSSTSLVGAVMRP